MQLKSKARAVGRLLEALLAPEIVAERPPLAAPASLGFRMPAEWEPHRATWIGWPHEASDWPGRFEAVPFDYVEMVRCLAAGEDVCILVQDEWHEARASELLRRRGIDLRRTSFHRLATDRGWLRDSGPIFVTRKSTAGQPRGGAKLGRMAILDWKFNAWAKYTNWQRDELVPAYVAGVRKLARIEPGVEERGGWRRIVLEGGAFDVNGSGLLLTTAECLLSDLVQARNPGLGRADLERVFAEFLGIRKTIWLGRGIAGDDTHGHVDDVARFVGPRTVVAAYEDDPHDVNHEPLKENWTRLKRARGLDGKPLGVVKLPMPRPVAYEGYRLPASYANFYIANAAVLVPTFNDPADRIALDVLQRQFRDRPVIGIHAVNLVIGLGTLHCLTQQEPRV
jgi:agmatine deiminase